MDFILIEELLVRCIVGINPDERRERQDVTIDITLGVDTSKPGASDDFADAVDYRALKKSVFAMVEKSEFFLVEKMAEEIAAICLQDPGVIQAEVTVRKPSALRFARDVGVRILRKKDSA